MSSTIRHLDAANLFVGDDDPTNSLFLILKNVKLPSLEEVTKEHMGGGAVAGIELGMRAIQPLKFPFQLEGFNPEQISRFMPGSGRIKYTMRGNIRDIRDHTDLEVKAVIEGRMTKVEMSEFEKEKGINTDYEIKEVAFYSLFYNGVEKFYFDYFSGPAGVRMDGQPMFPALSRNLGLV